MQSRGVALVLALIALAFFSALGLALVLTSATDRLTATNYADTLDALDAAEGALELAAREMTAMQDWSAVLSGAVASRFTDGAPSGGRILGALAVDLTGLTNEMTCGSTAACTDARIRTSTSDRPWGDNNPRWQMFLYGPLAAFTDIAGAFRGVYVIVWIGDDAREIDGNPLVDGGAAGEGQNIVRARALAIARGGSRRAVEADFVKPCEISDGVTVCSTGIHVQSWRVWPPALP